MKAYTTEIKYDGNRNTYTARSNVPGLTKEAAVNPTDLVKRINELLLKVMQNKELWVRIDLKMLNVCTEFFGVRRMKHREFGVW